MPRRLVVAAMLLSLPVASFAVSPRPVRGTAATAAFEKLKSLVGDWDADIDGDGKGDATVTYRLTAQGSVLVETLFAGASHEMITMYHANGDEIWMTHYCSAGNQPRMRLVAAEPAIRFDFVDGTNLRSRDDRHMGSAAFELLDADHVKAEWISFEARKPGFVAKFDMRRRKT